MASPFTFRTKPTGPHATFRFDCPRCRQEATVTNGRVDSHECTPRKPLPLTVWADPEEVSDWQEIRKGILNRLDQALDNR